MARHSPRRGARKSAIFGHPRTSFSFPVSVLGLAGFPSLFGTLPARPVDQPPDLWQLIAVPVQKRREIAYHVGKQAGLCITSRFYRSGSPSDAPIDRSQIRRAE